MHEKSGDHYGFSLPKLAKRTCNVRKGFGNLSELTSGYYPARMEKHRLKIVKVNLTSSKIRVAWKGGT